MNKLLSVVVICIYAFSCCDCVLAQEKGDAANAAKPVSAIFNRKSITIVPIVSNKYKSYADVFTKAVSNAKGDARYDVNTVSAASLENTGKAILTTMDKLGSDSALTAVLKATTIVRDVLKTSCNMDSISSRVARQKRREDASAASAEKISAPTAAQLFTLVNGSHIVLAMLDSVKTENGVQFYASIAVVNINVDNAGGDWITEGNAMYPNPAQVELRTIGRRNLSRSASNTDASKSSNPLGKALAAVEDKSDPSEKASRYIAEDVFNYLSSLDAFLIRASFQDDNNGIDAGNREGVYADMNFKVYETMLGDDGKISSQYKGYGRIDEVGDNASNYKNVSRLYPKIGSFGQGMTAVSYEQGLQIGFSPCFRTVNISKEMPALLGDAWSADAGSALGLVLDAKYNLAAKTGVPQLFVGIGVGFGWINAPAQLSALQSWVVSPPFLLDVNMNITRKYDLGRWAATAGLDLGFSTVAFHAENTSSNLSADVAVGTNYCIGLQGGLEYQLSADLIMGVNAGYRLQLTGVDEINISYSDGRKKSYVVPSSDPLSSSNYGGAALGVKIICILPRLF